MIALSPSTSPDEEVLLADLGLVVLHGAPPLAAGERSTLEELPGLDGARRVGARGGAGAFVIEGKVRAATPAELTSMLDELGGVEGEQVIRSEVYPDREWVGFLQRDATRCRRIGPQQVAVHADLVMEYSCPDPLARARAETASTGTEVALVYGTAPMPLRVEVENTGAQNITRIVVELLAADDSVVRTLDWSGAVLPGDTWVVDAETHSIHNDSSDARGGRSTASVYPHADRAEGVVAVKVTYYRGLAANGGGVEVTTRYRRRWRHLG